ncbi:MAG: hypothetical protein FWH03_02045 [Firmicutes bacterium]|nr:hypothetical protein [Bacillota bacterium]
MEQKKLPSILTIIGGKVLTMLINKKNLSYEDAAKTFYTSRVYDILSDEGSKLWHMSADMIYDLLDEELTSGMITFPQEQ